MAAFNHVASRGQDCCPQPCSINFILVSKWVQAVGVAALIIFLLSFRTDQFSKCAVCRNWLMGAVSQNQVLLLSFVGIFLFLSWGQRWLLNTNIVFLQHPSIVKKNEFPFQDPKHRLPLSHRRGVMCSLWTSAETRSMLRDSRLSCDQGGARSMSWSGASWIHVRWAECRCVSAKGGWGDTGTPPLQSASLTQATLWVSSPPFLATCRRRWQRGIKHQLPTALECRESYADTVMASFDQVSPFSSAAALAPSQQGVVPVLFRKSVSKFIPIFIVTGQCGKSSEVSDWGNWLGNISVKWHNWF